MLQLLCDGPMPGHCTMLGVWCRHRRMSACKKLKVVNLEVPYLVKRDSHITLQLFCAIGHDAYCWIYENKYEEALEIVGA